MSFGNTIKKKTDIASAYAKGVRLFAFDSEIELEKLAAAAPGAQVFCRVLMECDGAEWPLSKKFGCSPRMRSEERRVGKECVIRVDLGGRRNIKKKKKKT